MHENPSEINVQGGDQPALYPHAKWDVAIVDGHHQQPHV